MANLRFTDTDLDLINELLRVASVSLQETVITVESRYPGSPFIETLRTWMEQAADIRERIEARGDDSLSDYSNSRYT